MSTASRLTLGMAVTVSTAIIGYVHYKQSADRLRLHDGVLRDVEQQQRRKHENTYTLQQQIDITKQLKAREASSNSSDTPTPPRKEGCNCAACREAELQQQSGAEESGVVSPAEDQSVNLGPLSDKV
ncbi:protein PET117 homolog, mitochondrial [Drosophila elegans]|uniref:protein PET117 homolog, mitochondrial n=1 Tax=Drosophila elegans TaxID=30023 RepID=UPI0007E700D2|nr:protein PET117 homolog, mitochondrial [Drosophila elegans]